MNPFQPKQKPQQKLQQSIQQLPPQCIDTKLLIWQNNKSQQFQIVFLNQVYPQKFNKNTVTNGSQIIFHFLSTSLYYWVQFTNPQSLQPDKLSLKDQKFIQTLFNQQTCQNAQNFQRWGQYFMKQDLFHLKQSQQPKFKIPQGQKIHEYDRNNQHFVIYRYLGNNKQLIEYKKRFQILFLFYIDGVSFVSQQSQQWQYLITYKQTHLPQQYIFIGVLSKFIFKLTSIKQRHRISQVLILPKYQTYGHGKQLLDVVYQSSLNLQQCFQITAQSPSFEYQCLRDYKELELILNKHLIDLTKIPKITSKQDMQSAYEQHIVSKSTLRQIKQQVKIPGSQIQRLVSILIYAKILSSPQNQIPRAHFQQFTKHRIIFNRSAFKSRKKVPHITFQGSTSDMKQFFIQKAKQDQLRNQQQIQQILNQTIQGFNRVIKKLQKTEILQQKYLTK